MKEAGLKTIRNDSLRFQKTALYDYYYGIIEILDNINEMQSFEPYFASVNKLLHPYLEFDDGGNLKNIALPKGLNEIQRKEILSYLWRLENNRRYKIGKYKSIMQVMKEVKQNIEKELKQ